MKISVIQAPLAWEDAAANRTLFTALIATIEATNLVVLPEMFTTGFTMNPAAVAETMQGASVQWMKDTAVAKGCAITGSLVIEEGGRYYNRLVFAKPNGTIDTYNKRHLFTLAGEDKVYTAGKERLVVTYMGWKICLLVCYDLRFPAYSRNTGDYDVLLYVANWPQVRTPAWDALLKARAIENLSYTVGVNRVGNDANGHAYSGHTQAIDMLGNYIVAPLENEQAVTFELDKQLLEQTRSKFAFLNDRDTFTIDL